MADNYIPIQIYVLKIDLQCCQTCPEKVNKMLQKIKGVHDVYINTEEGLVIITGFLDPALVRKTIENVGIEAEFVAYEKDPIRAKKKLDLYLQIGHVKHGSPSNSKDKKRRVKDQQPDHGYNVTGYMAYDHVPQWPNSIYWYPPNHNTTRVFPGPISAFARLNHVHPNDHLMIYNRQPPPPWYNRTRPPPPYPFSIYERQEQDFGNSFHHILSDENVGACSIM